MRHLVVAMIVAWVIHLIYLISLAVRQSRLRREVGEMRALLERLEQSTTPSHSTPTS